MPDNFDYEWLKRLLEHPERWKDEDLSAARLMLSTQQSALADMHPKDVRGRRSAQELVDVLEAAIESHLARRA